MFEWIFKPVRKIKPLETVDTPIQSESSVVDKILSIPTLDEICSDIVTSRSMIRSNTISIVKLMEMVSIGKDVQNQHLSAVALSVYFKEAGLPPSECFQRLNTMILSGQRIPSKIHQDLEALYDEFRRLESL